MLEKLSLLFNRAPVIGARKDRSMPDPTPPSPAPSPAAAPAPALAPDVTAHLTALAEAMRQLAESQKTLIESVKPAAVQPAAAPVPSTDISGDPAAGVSPGALGAIDYSRLSPLQQITLGLRDARPTAQPRAGAD